MNQRFVLMALEHALGMLILETVVAVIIFAREAESCPHLEIALDAHLKSDDIVPLAPPLSMHYAAAGLAMQLIALDTKCRPEVFHAGLAVDGEHVCSLRHFDRIPYVTRTKGFGFSPHRFPGPCIIPILSSSFVVDVLFPHALGHSSHTFARFLSKPRFLDAHGRFKLNLMFPHLSCLPTSRFVVATCHVAAVRPLNFASRVAYMGISSAGRRLALQVLYNFHCGRTLENIQLEQFHEFS
jgi:hypothetical protein